METNYSIVYLDIPLYNVLNSCPKAEEAAILRPANHKLHVVAQLHGYLSPINIRDARDL